ncbi:cytosine permease [Polaribacter sp.]|jgi:cytosine permease|nr:cytosine permease [Polaribacter sp.]MDB9853551.1 cytosine permease [bacterium]|tara:strand:- start:1357 stop:2556 length:1200 start_codon:yes stop_codon:yes gene_type:complete
MENNKNTTKWYSLAGIWFGGIVSVPALLVGSTLIASLSFNYSIWAGLIGFSFVVLFMSLLSIAAVEKRKATVSLAASSFGVKGAKLIVGLVIGLSTLGWFGIQSNIAGASFSKILVEMNGPEIPVWISSVFWGIIMVLTAVFGFKYLKWLNYVAVPAIVLLLAYGLFIVFQEHSFQEILNFKPSEPMPLLQAIGFTIGFISVGGVISPDYNRFAATKKDAILGSIFGIIPSALCLLAIGAILAITQGTYDIVEIFSSLGFPFFAMSILILATWTSNVMNVYSSGLAFNDLFNLSTAARSKTTLFVGLVGILLAAIGILSHFMSFISLLTITITPIAGVMISDYFISKTYQETPENINWKGVFSWISGVVVMLVMTSQIKNILGIIVAAFVYFILKKNIK